MRLKAREWRETSKVFVIKVLPLAFRFNWIERLAHWPTLTSECIGRVRWRWILCLASFFYSCAMMHICCQLTKISKLSSCVHCTIFFLFLFQEISSEQRWTRRSFFFFLVVLRKRFLLVATGEGFSVHQQTNNLAFNQDEIRNGKKIIHAVLQSGKDDSDEKWRCFLTSKKHCLCFKIEII